MVMKLEEDLLRRLRSLPPDAQREVLDFTTWLEERRTPKKGKSLAGLWSKYDIAISEDELKQLRREMWSKFPREP